MVKPIPQGWHSVTPRMFVQDVAEEVRFLWQAFGATGELRTATPSEIRIGDSLVMVSSTGTRAAMPAYLYLYVEDADATYRLALEAGAVSLEEPKKSTLRRPQGHGAGPGRQHLADRNPHRRCSRGGGP
jgi:PhnB protein